MVTFANVNGYAAALSNSFIVKPRQPVWGNRSVTASTTLTIFEYDIMTPYGAGDFIVSNDGQESRKMVGWGMIVTLGILSTVDLIYTLFADPWNGTFTEIDQSPVAITGSAKYQCIGPIRVGPCAQICGRLIAASVAGPTTVTYQSSLTDY